MRNINFDFLPVPKMTGMFLLPKFELNGLDFHSKNSGLDSLSGAQARPK